MVARVILGVEMELEEEEVERGLGVELEVGVDALVEEVIIEDEMRVEVEEGAVADE